MQVSNKEKYLQEIPSYQEEAKKYFLVSLPFAAMFVYFILDSFISGQFGKLIEQQLNDADKVILAIKTSGTFLVWHEIFLRAENRISKMKRAIRDYCQITNEPFAPIRYSITTKCINFLMPLHDNSPLPPNY